MSWDKFLSMLAAFVDCRDRHRDEWHSRDDPPACAPISSMSCKNPTVVTAKAKGLPPGRALGEVSRSGWP
jgi:hypothetical protein